MAKEAPARTRMTWPGDPEGEIEKRREKERLENQAALRRKAGKADKTDNAPAAAPTEE